MLNRDLNAFLVGNHLKLLSTKRFKEGYLWEVKKIHSENPCLQCGSMETVRAGKCTTTVREEAVRSVALWLKIHKHRIYCKDCKKTFTEPEPGIWREEDQRRDLGRLSLRTVGR